MVFLRAFVFLFLVLVLLIVPYKDIWVRLLFVFYALFLINEVFNAFKISRLMPPLRVSDVNTITEDIVSYQALKAYAKAESAFDLVISLHKKIEIRFIIEKIDPEMVISPFNITKDELLEKAFDLAKTVNADYIREVDLFVAYLLLTEDRTKLLQRNDLRQEDVVNLLHWARNKFLSQNLSWEIVFSGEGIFDSLLTGWNTEAKKYAQDLTKKVLSYKFPPLVIGRDKEYEELLSILAKDRENNVILVGEPGTGKTSLLEYFAYASFMRNVPNKLVGKRVYEIAVDKIIAGVGNQGELEARIRELFQDIYYSSNTIIFVQNIENIFGGGGFNLDITGAIFEYLKEGKVQIVGTTTRSAYKTRLENRDQIKTLFDVIFFLEPDEKSALFMIFEKVVEIEKKHRVWFSYGAVKQTVELSSSYFVDRYLPGKAISLLEELAADANALGRKLIEAKDVVGKIERKTKVVISAPTADEKKILLSLEDKMHKRIIGQDFAVDALSGAIRRLRSGFKSARRPIGTFLFLGPTGVGKTETARVLADIYFGSEKNMIRLDMSEYQTQDSLKRLLGSLPGENYSPSEFLEEMRERPFSLVLLDEFEKADSRVQDVFLQVFEDGRITDNLGRTVSFVNAIIIATSNAGAEFVREKIKEARDNSSFKKEVISLLLEKGVFKPELVNRFDEIVFFKPLSKEETRKIASLILAFALKEFEKKSIYINFDDKILDKIVYQGYDLEFGARNIRRYIENNIESYISVQYLDDKIKKGDRKLLTVDNNENIILV